MNICLLVVYWGPFPPWFDGFLTSCAHNPGIDWLILSDQHVIDSSPPDNVKIDYLDEVEFKVLVKNKLGLTPVMQSAHKLCDYKPTYGHLFEERLNQYDYWGHCDMDVIWGDIESWLYSIDLASFDIISTRKHTISGHFTLYRNSVEINTLFQNVNGYKKCFEIGTYAGFDEGYFAFYVYQRSIDGRGPLGCYWDTKIGADWPLLIRRPRGWKWKKGKIIDSDGIEWVYLHFMTWKKMLSKTDFSFVQEVDQFRITRIGLFTKNLSIRELLSYYRPTHVLPLLKYYSGRLIYRIKIKMLKLDLDPIDTIPVDYRQIKD